MHFSSLKISFGSFYIFRLTSNHVCVFLYIYELSEDIYNSRFTVLSAHSIISVILLSVSIDRSAGHTSYFPAFCIPINFPWMLYSVRFTLAFAF